MSNATEAPSLAPSLTAPSASPTTSAPSASPATSSPTCFSFDLYRPSIVNASGPSVRYFRKAPYLDLLMGEADLGDALVLDPPTPPDQSHRFYLVDPLSLFSYTGPLPNAPSRSSQGLPPGTTFAPATGRFVSRPATFEALSAYGVISMAYSAEAAAPNISVYLAPNGSLVVQNAWGSPDLVVNETTGFLDGFNPVEAYPPCGPLPRFSSLFWLGLNSGEDLDRVRYMPYMNITNPIVTAWNDVLNLPVVYPDNAKDTATFSATLLVSAIPFVVLAVLTAMSLPCLRFVSEVSRRCRRRRAFQTVAKTAAPPAEAPQARRCRLPARGCCGRGCVAWTPEEEQEHRARQEAAMRLDSFSTMNGARAEARRCPNPRACWRSTYSWWCGRRLAYPPAAPVSSFAEFPPDSGGPNLATTSGSSFRNLTAFSSAGAANSMKRARSDPAKAAAKLAAKRRREREELLRQQKILRSIVKPTPVSRRFCFLFASTFLAALVALFAYAVFGEPVRLDDLTDDDTKIVSAALSRARNASMHGWTVVGEEVTAAAATSAAQSALTQELKWLALMATESDPLNYRARYLSSDALIIGVEALQIVSLIVWLLVAFVPITLVGSLILASCTFRWGSEGKPYFRRTSILLGCGIRPCLLFVAFASWIMCGITYLGLALTAASCGGPGGGPSYLFVPVANRARWNSTTPLPYDPDWGSYGSIDLINWAAFFAACRFDLEGRGVGNPFYPALFDAVAARRVALRLAREAALPLSPEYLALEREVYDVYLNATSCESVGRPMADTMNRECTTGIVWKFVQAVCLAVIPLVLMFSVPCVHWIAPNLYRVEEAELFYRRVKRARDRRIKDSISTNLAAATANNNNNNPPTSTHLQRGGSSVMFNQDTSFMNPSTSSRRSGRFFSNGGSGKRATFRTSSDTSQNEDGLPEAEPRSMVSPTASSSQHGDSWFGGFGTPLSSARGASSRSFAEPPPGRVPGDTVALA